MYTPIGLGLATFVRKHQFNKAEQEMGKASFTMGLFGITEGQSFCAQDPLRIIPANMIGAMIASVIGRLEVSVIKLLMEVLLSLY